MVLRGLADAQGVVPVEENVPGWPYGRPRVPVRYCLDAAAQRAAFDALLQDGVLAVSSNSPDAKVTLVPPLRYRPRS